MSVCLPVCLSASLSPGSPHVIITHDTIGQSQVTWDPRPTCSNLFTWTPLPSRPVQTYLSESGWRAFNWKTFLFITNSLPLGWDPLIRFKLKFQVKTNSKTTVCLPFYLILLISFLHLHQTKQAICAFPFTFNQCEQALNDCRLYKLFMTLNQCEQTLNICPIFKLFIPLRPCLQVTFFLQKNGQLLFNIVSMVTGWITDKMVDDPLCPLFIDTLLNNNGAFWKNVTY